MRLRTLTVLSGLIAGVMQPSPAMANPVDMWLVTEIGANNELELVETRLYGRTVCFCTSEAPGEPVIAETEVKLEIGAEDEMVRAQPNRGLRRKARRGSKSTGAQIALGFDLAANVHPGFRRLRAGPDSDDNDSGTPNLPEASPKIHLSRVNGTIPPGTCRIPQPPDCRAPAEGVPEQAADDVAHADHGDVDIRGPAYCKAKVGGKTYYYRC